MVLGTGMTTLYIALGGGAAGALFAGILHFSREDSTPAEREPLIAAATLVEPAEATKSLENEFLEKYNAYKRALFRSSSTIEYF